MSLKSLEDRICIAQSAIVAPLVANNILLEFLTCVSHYMLFQPNNIGYLSCRDIRIHNSLSN